MKKFQIIIDKCRLCTDVWLLCCSVGWKIEVNVLNMICTWKELLWVVTWHMTCVLYCCCRETISRGILLSQHTHVGFPRSTICAPVVSPIICTWLPTIDRVLATLSSKIFPVKIFCIFCN